MQRNENESFEDYKIRRKAANEATKEALAPKMVWYSPEDGTYYAGKNKLKALAKAKRKGV